MLVLIPNPNQTAELVKAQKDFLKNSSATVSGTATFPPAPLFYQNTPLWIFLEGQYAERDFTKEQLKELAGGIEKVQLSAPQIHFSEKLNQNVFESRAVIKTNKGELEGSLILCKSVKATGTTAQAQDGAPQQPAPSEAFMTLKIFRVANAVRPDEHSLAVTDFVWKKLKLQEI